MRFMFKQNIDNDNDVYMYTLNFQNSVNLINANNYFNPPGFSLRRARVEARLNQNPPDMHISVIRKCTLFCRNVRKQRYNAANQIHMKNHWSNQPIIWLRSLFIDDYLVLFAF